ncbi:DUF72 domain-containing protein [Mangrovicella endophytica]|uniref:DUF72 domain-containing protein n=1 Tax=Mangrovicella endophytica TaxID=2066697 RepID=UPI001FE1047F|nr:DUF72 domain-containing protein [Mangrovicella endophytica]
MPGDVIPIEADMRLIRVGTAGWSIPAPYAERFPGAGSHLERYARHMATAEINTSFYRPHRRTTYQRWADSVPDDFRFAVKLPKAISHEARLIDVAEPLERCLGEAAGLGDKLGVLLLQLPPSLAFDAAAAGAFLRILRERHDGLVALEPRHGSWFTPAVDELLTVFRVARVAADPAPVPDAAGPGGWPGLVYLRLHGSPRIYYSAYEPEVLDRLAEKARRHAAAGTPVWIILDNTAAGAALGDALAVEAHLAERTQG